jgi:site-specific DNA-methyltransferase (adenine-specific)
MSAAQWNPADNPWVSKDGNVELWLGDCLDILPQLDVQVDSVVTDPPYGLEFMGSSWDHGVPGKKFWEAIMEVCKPGCFLFSFGGTRTFHRMYCGIEDAGWTLKDTCLWLYGQGFPKSLDISKAIDKAAGAEREVIAPDPEAKRRNRTTSKFSGCYGEIDDAESCPVTSPTTPLAKHFQGFGTGLKPAFEPICVAMKPLDGTFAENAEKHGVAGLNIDGCRVEYDEGDDIHAKNPHTDGGIVDGQVYGKGRKTRYEVPSGRFPANIIHDGSDEVLEEFEQQSQFMGMHGAGGATNKQVKTKTHSGVEFLKSGGKERRITRLGDSGSAARFFYTAKASRAERGKKNKHPTVKPVAVCRYLCRLSKTPTGGVVLDPFMGSGTTGIACIREGRKFIGIEKDPKWFAIAMKRIKKEFTRIGFGLQYRKD